MAQKADLDFRPVTISEALAAGVEDLIADHSQEVSPLQGALGVGIDWPSYLSEERRGLLKTLGVWSGRKLVGYAAFSLQRMAQRSNTLVAFNRGLYLAPEFRGQGSAFVAEAEKFVASHGAQAVVQDVLAYHSTDDKRRAKLEALLIRKGYAPYARLFMKVI